MEASWFLAFFTESQFRCRRRLYEHQEHALYSPLFPELKRCRTFLDGSSLEIQTLVVISYGRICSNRQNLLTCTLCSSITYFQLMHMHSSRFLLHYDHTKTLYHVRGKISTDDAINGHCGSSSLGIVTAAFMIEDIRSHTSTVAF